MTAQIKLYGQIAISGEIETLTGLHVGGTEVGLQIGGADSTVVRNGLDGRPYIPGSSLKGKMRGLLDRIYAGDKLIELIRSDKKPIRIHLCENPQEYKDCFLCNLFGITPEKVQHQNLPTRLVVRDASLTKDSAEALERSLYTDMPFTQVKTEVVLDRITSAATPRQIERVPAGVRFTYSIVFNIYSPDDVKWLDKLTEGMDLLEQDYIGGQGSRGYGQIKFATRKAEYVSFNGATLDAAEIQAWCKNMER